MSSTIYGDYWASGELANTNKYQRFKANKNIILRAIRTVIIINNNPTFTNLNMKIYSDNSSGQPGVLIATSTNTPTKSEIITENNGYREIYFTFNDVSLNGNDYYHVVINGAGYVYSSSSHLAWAKAWPKPVLTENFTPTKENLGIAPYYIYLIGSEF